jgi:ABC-type nitrate/sulfonate/bicarbonate transport system substrate-binding protein
MHCNGKEPSESFIPPQSAERRDFLKKSATLSAAAGLMAMVPPGVRSGAWAAGSDGLEKNSLTFGIIPLTDCAPIVIAHEKGFFKKHGLGTAISKEASWANIRDKVSIGALDGAHMLAGMPIAATLGVGATPKDTITAFSMDLNGNGITVSNELYERMVEADPAAMRTRPTTAAALKKVIEADKKAGREPMTLAMVFPVSTHNYELRYWLGSAGINPDKDIRLIVIPPPQMVANLQSKNIAGYCVGEPWNQRAVEMGIGHALVTDYEIWKNNPEKVFGVTLEWAEKHPNTHKAVIKALIEACEWSDRPENRKEVVQIISQKSYVNAPADVVDNSMTGTWRYNKVEAPQPMPDFNVFYRYAANFPWLSHAAWYITQMYRWGQLDTPLDIHKAAARIYRPDLYRIAAREVGVPYPTADWKTEGLNKNPWVLRQASAPIPMGPDTFFDGMTYDPKKLVAYLKGFKVSNATVDMKKLARLNA